MKKITLAVLALLLICPAHAQPEFQPRERLLIEAIDTMGARTAEEAAAMWGRGLYLRSGALQYAMMSKALKSKYIQQLDQYNQYWVTGMSSPWIDAYAIEVMMKNGPKAAEILMSFDTVSSAGPDRRYNAILRLVLEDGFWRINSIQSDKGLYPYMGLICDNSEP